MKKPRQNPPRKKQEGDRHWKNPDAEFDVFGFLIDIAEELEQMDRQAHYSDHLHAARASAYINGLEDLEPLDEILEREKFMSPRYQKQTIHVRRKRRRRK